MEPTTTHPLFPPLTRPAAALARAALVLALAAPALGPAPARAAQADAAVEIDDARFAAELASASTRFRTRGRRARLRARNVELAAKLLHGAELAPGAVLSFNGRVGERSEARGFMPAPVIANGRIRLGLGGGVCQVSTTLHLAALRAGLEIVEHRTHSRPAPYAPAGLDATVSWGRIDYRVRNPHPFPVRVRAEAADGVLAVALEGAEEVSFEVDADLLRELPVAEREVEDPSLAPGERVVEEEGRAGRVVRVMRVDAEGRREVRRLRYRSAPRVVRVGVAVADEAGEGDEASEGAELAGADGAGVDGAGASGAGVDGAGASGAGVDGEPRGGRAAAYPATEA
ncbi:MAG TPA: VanW family protein [Polyangiaceae bacterium LLY-WYZ-15_(1-7)]|nr:hypothetical protein [Myxococcales bacterium]MAT24082.1 hypothetical protein [Sandaracinus sp.]HJL03937.1 VanW family protein [Polyangiaceae bacterium LLY-WYZ-15_(1-7)]MBJ70940.1 hypothetical protein [Sandaracinus sp.]HJL07673.1 VanW family protein [Polyangiaceae bacterium LLY-WYZ-15_(1-7)]